MGEKRYEDWNFDTTVKADRAPRGGRKKHGGGLLEFLLILIVAFALVFGFVRPFVVEAFYIPSGSMIPTLEVGDRVLVNKFIYRFEEPERGDVIVFESVEPNPDGSRDDLIKRVVAVGGDEVAVRDGELFINGEVQNEPFVNDEFPDASFFGPTVIPEGRIFAMGDNRSNSRDSRFFGPVPIENIEGEAFIVFWPLSRIGLL
ncbi:MAG: Signal peptidase I [uncultured Rubrobacteraceae bacterium]|uniref:Signal peptidase I n=1 Tax=uncultured Rubrobacteraceae bacterium TaxID=349277 RepID=A0A6J4SBV4_9ACTN|nr:MAG: Signal peptidase I [uncultured Rubrobacteraceae bacterium]